VRRKIEDLHGLVGRSVGRFLQFSHSVLSSIPIIQEELEKKKDLHY
jgi:hypothetical protein